MADNPPPGGARALVCVSRFNEAVTRRLLDGALAALDQGRYPRERVDVVWVPGAFELSIALQRGLGTGRYALAVALGAIVRGETPHFDFIARDATRGIGDTARRFAVPVGLGLLTCDTIAQAMARAGGDAGNKGAEAAEAAIETARALDRLDADAAT